MCKLSRTPTLILILTATMISAVVPAFASASGRKNTALAMTAATVYAAFQKNKLPAVALAAGSVAAWKKYEDARKQESRYNYRSESHRRSCYGPDYERSSRGNERSYSRYTPSRNRTANYSKPGYNRRYVRAHR